MEVTDIYACSYEFYVTDCLRIMNIQIKAIRVSPNVIKLRIRIKISVSKFDIGVFFYEIIPNELTDMYKYVAALTNGEKH